MRGPARFKNFGADGYCNHLLVITLLFVDHPFFSVTLHEPVRFSNSSSLRRSRSPAQLNLGNRRASKVVTERYEGLWRSKADTSRCETSISSTVETIVLLSRSPRYRTHPKQS